MVEWRIAAARAVRGPPAVDSIERRPGGEGIGAGGKTPQVRGTRPFLAARTRTASEDFSGRTFEKLMLLVRRRARIDGRGPPRASGGFNNNCSNRLCHLEFEIKRLR